mmetsp:Transcript_69442/g.160903  ORF Transcript_69442/g.160903 Transcript_69442/m.160903 type:complete len:201 (+) Transcript_69442:744-1346(+)
MQAPEVVCEDKGKQQGENAVEVELRSIDHGRNGFSRAQKAAGHALPPGLVILHHVENGLDNDRYARRPAECPERIGVLQDDLCILGPAGGTPLTASTRVEQQRQEAEEEGAHGDDGVPPAVGDALLGHNGQAFLELLKAHLSCVDNGSSLASALLGKVHGTPVAAGEGVEQHEAKHEPRVEAVRDGAHKQGVLVLLVEPN